MFQNKYGGGGGGRGRVSLQGRWGQLEPLPSCLSLAFPSGGGGGEESHNRMVKSIANREEGRGTTGKGKKGGAKG